MGGGIGSRHEVFSQREFLPANRRVGVLAVVYVEAALPAAVAIMRKRGAHVPEAHAAQGRRGGGEREGVADVQQRGEARRHPGDGEGQVY